MTNRPDGPPSTREDADTHESGPTGPPLARIERAPIRRSLTWLVWLVPVAAIALSIGFSVRSARARGPVITVLAQHGYGLGAGDAVRYLGIEVGRIESVGLSAEAADATAVRLEVRLLPDAGRLAREGTRFWIVRPELSLDSVEGLDTIIGAQYLALKPGPEGALPTDVFTALDEIPLADELESERGVEIILEARSRYGLSAGAALTYRGVRIGTVTAVGLASDATMVEVRVRVRGAFAQLVRERTVFWETGGFELALSLSGGLKVDIDSLKAAFVGGLAMATPVDSGAAVTEGARFELFDNVDPEWLTWSPALPLGSDLLPPGAPMPRLVRGSLRWQEGRILKSDKSRIGWFHVVEDGLVGPADLLRVPDDAREGRATLHIAGRELSVAALVNGGQIQDVERAPGLLARLTPEAFGTSWESLSGGANRASAQELRTLTAPEDLILVREAGRDPIGVDAQRLTVIDSGVFLDGLIPVSERWHGASALARSDGAQVGIVLSADEGSAARIVPR